MSRGCGPKDRDDPGSADGLADVALGSSRNWKRRKAHTSFSDGYLHRTILILFLLKGPSTSNTLPTSSDDCLLRNPTDKSNVFS